MTEHNISTIDVHELKNRRDTDPALSIIDVREDHEWQSIRIPGALHIPKDEISDRIEAHIPDRERPIYLHCRGGMRSLYAANCLLDMGYRHVYSINGGISEWARQGYPVEE